MYLGIDLGTSALKAVLLADDGRIVAQQSAPLEVSRPHPQWSEQSPADWWRALTIALAELARGHAGAMRAVRAIGLSGQMHGAVLLDAAGEVLRPAILWNDGRSEPQCAELTERVPRLAQIAIIDHRRSWTEAARRVTDQIGYAVWPLAKERAPGQTILDTAHQINRRHDLPLSRADVLAECRRIATAATTPRTHVRGR